jgi:hypothetical protein
VLFCPIEAKTSFSRCAEYTAGDKESQEYGRQKAEDGRWKTKMRGRKKKTVV